ncbi:GNAT family N-acetyltransferase [Microlunatus soli]|uniref:Acetyltransferase (GNAT) domain-containing protein n=1 Tax=Microlunatus soli TaxID=630515 RepID=A0A1H1YIW1_9ACTN|nr:GNAT family N-acetyltransferase [Microlunatus soli]SDT21488.1 Acetyltransferase (GNAT) domain-containing protein [Microlunatus soli]
MPDATSVIPVTPEVRLRPVGPSDLHDDLLHELLVWYRDRDTVRMVDGPGAELYDLGRLKAMVRYLSEHGELYLIERLTADQRWAPIGDAGLQTRAMPIVLAPAHRGGGIGRAVIGALIERARALGWPSVEVSEIFHDNLASRRAYESAGFMIVGETEHGHSYRLPLA